ncbi:hypothetical protein E4Z66_06845 [Aliishimia ponticola]|uniref:Uncharacterized protein n=1 Tax=Aliishimia ponticola TaxID=2499833 RepID=A0A4S4NBA6_9RHOB|nr:hypothetical protein [Aliishimia ponticola]THH36662.1 hypothetical protein E4Z66_06845 [Aliishimia ponticola]
MLWLAGLLGLMAVGAFALFDFSTPNESDEMEDLPDIAEGLELIDGTPVAEASSDTADAEADDQAPPSKSTSENDVDSPPLSLETFAIASDKREDGLDSSNFDGPDYDGTDEDPLDVEILVGEMLGDPTVDDGMTLAEELAAAAKLLAVSEDAPEADGSETDAWDQWFGEDPDLSGFDPDTDELFVIWDDTSGDVPDLTIVPGADATQIRLGDAMIGKIEAGLHITADNIALMPLSTAQGLGWAPA